MEQNASGEMLLWYEIGPLFDSKSARWKKNPHAFRLRSVNSWSSSDTMGNMGKAGKVLRQVLESYGISQNKLALTLGVKPSVVFRWFHEQTDPSAETVRSIAEALQGLDPAAADEFVRLYLGDYLQDRDKTWNMPGVYLK